MIWSDRLQKVNFHFACCVVGCSLYCLAKPQGRRSPPEYGPCFGDHGPIKIVKGCESIQPHTNDSISSPDFQLMMALSFSSTITLPASKLTGHGGGEASVLFFKCTNRGGSTRRRFLTNCQPMMELSSSSSNEMKLPGSSSQKLEIGTAVIVTEAPKWLKTAASVPCLRVNSGLVNPGDVGRIVSRKPKDVWAVRLTIGTYLIDGKYFKPLELDQ